jgi:hypothetical protein
MSQHTPGPWVVSSIDNTLYVGNSTAYVARAFLCHPLTECESQANAHLISAAPDLLAALKRMVAITNGKGKDTDWFAAWSQADTAIARAEGRTP